MNMHDESEWRVMDKYPEIEANENGVIRMRDSKEILQYRYAKSDNRYYVRYDGETRRNIQVGPNVLVASLFIPNPNRGRYVKFRDGDKTNCKANNLYWANKLREEPPILFNCSKMWILDIMEDIDKRLVEYVVKT